MWVGAILGQLNGAENEIVALRIERCELDGMEGFVAGWSRPFGAAAAPAQRIDFRSAAPRRPSHRR
jgi:hypothetical protein